MSQRRLDYGGAGGRCRLLRQARLWENRRGKGAGASDQSGGLTARAGLRPALPRIAMPALPQPCSRENTLGSNPGTITSGTRFNNEPIYGLTPPTFLSAAEAEAGGSSGKGSERRAWSVRAWSVEREDFAATLSRRSAGSQLGVEFGRSANPLKPR